METVQEVKPVLFVAPAALELTLVIKSEEVIAVEGHAIKQRAHRIHFKKKPYGGAFRGEFLTSNQDEIDFIREHEWFKKGPAPVLEDTIIIDRATGRPITQGVSLGTSRAIYESEYNPDEVRVAPDTVKVFGKPENPTSSSAPSQGNMEPLPAKIDRRLKQYRNKK